MLSEERLRQIEVLVKHIENGYCNEGDDLAITVAMRDLLAELRSRPYREPTEGDIYSAVWVADMPQPQFLVRTTWVRSFNGCECPLNGRKVIPWSVFASLLSPPEVSTVKESLTIEIPKDRLTYCDQCEGCGWYEGGRAIVTWCETCGHSGVLVDGRAPTVDEKQQLVAQGVLKEIKLSYTCYSCNTTFYETAKGVSDPPLCQKCLDEGHRTNCGDVVNTRTGEIVEPAPVAFQVGDEVECVNGYCLPIRTGYKTVVLKAYAMDGKPWLDVRGPDGEPMAISAGRFCAHRPKPIESGKTFTEQQVSEALLAMKSHGYSLADKQSSFSIRYAVQQLASRLDISLAAVGIERGQT